MLHSESDIFSPTTFAQPLLAWHSTHGRMLPWMTKEPYDVWLSEVMLQQTQVSTVLERYASFKRCFPTVRALGAASLDAVLAQWSGLGYYRRARNLHACAQALVAWLDANNGQWPREASEWVALPGIGASTANAIVSACFNKVEPILDANAKRVLLRFAGDLSANDKMAWGYARQAMEVEPSQAAAYTQAIMDLGAGVCTAKKARCDVCPLSGHCSSKGWVYKKPVEAHSDAALSALASGGPKPVIAFDWALCIRGQGSSAQVLLAQRDNTSFWPQLWVLPTMDARFEAVAQNAPRATKHELSHRTLQLGVQTARLLAQEKDNERWVGLADVASRNIAVPSPVAAFLRHNV